MGNSATKKYLNKVLRKCPFAYRKAVKVSLCDSLYEYANKYPDCTENELTLRFGAPEKYTSEYIASLDSEQVAELLKRKSLTKKVLLVVVSLIILVIAILAVYICCEIAKTFGSYGEITVS